MSQRKKQVDVSLIRDAIAKIDKIPTVPNLVSLNPPSDAHYPDDPARKKQSSD